jgi:hypothetical protein
MKDEALKLALEALKSAAAELYRASSYCNTYEVLANTNDAIIAIQQALAAPVQDASKQFHEWAVSEHATLTATPPAQPATVPLTDELEALFTNIDHAISSGAWNVQKGSQTWEVIEEAKTAHGITEKGQP